MSSLFVHLTIVPALTVIGFGSKAKTWIDTFLVFEDAAGVVVESADFFPQAASDTAASSINAMRVSLRTGIPSMVQKEYGAQTRLDQTFALREVLSGRKCKNDV